MMAEIGNQQPPKRKRGGVAAGLATGGFGRPEDAVPPGGGEPSSPTPGTTTGTADSPESRSDEEREDQERLAGEEQERRAVAERERQKNEAITQGAPAAPTAPQAAAESTTEPERRGRGRRKIEGRDARTGRSFRATDEEYGVVYDTLDLLFERASPSERRKIEASAIIRAALRIAKQEPDRVLEEIREHNDFNP
jgi:hypothetical protein